MTRAKWYHHYILLASFVVLVIAASLWLHHRTLVSFGGLLQEAALLDSHQRELTSAGQRVVALNAPGNDVFESRQVAAERARYERSRGGLEIIRKTGNIDPARLAGFWQEVSQMCAAEERIFELIEEANVAGPSNPAALIKASEMMAIMDRHQMLAVKALGREQETAMNQTVAMLWDHQQLLLRFEELELVFVATLFMALGGMSWFFWKTQKTEELLLLHRRRLEDERRDRLVAVGELCSSVAHGIQNPLAAIRSSAELILDLGRLDPDSRRRSEDVITECTRLSRRVSRLLKFSRAENRVPQRIEVPIALREVCDELRPRFDQRNVRLEVDVAGKDMAVQADPDEWVTIMIELLSNALDHTPPGEEVRATCRRADDSIVIEVADRGAGVPAAATDKIFDLFYTTKEDGTGIGLATVKRIVVSLNGKIELVSQPDQAGSVFRVTLPAADAATEGHGPMPAKD